MKRLLTIIMVFCGAMAYAQTPVYKTTTGALNGSNAILRAGTDSYNIKDSLAKKATDSTVVKLTGNQTINGDLTLYNENDRKGHLILKSQEEAGAPIYNVTISPTAVTTDIEILLPSIPGVLASRLELNTKSNLSGAIFTGAITATNLSGTNTGDNATNTQYSGLATSKENTITTGTSAQYFRGDKTFQTLDKTAVGLANVDNTSDANKPVSTAQQTVLNLKAPIASPTFSGNVGIGAAANSAIFQVANTSTTLPSAYIYNPNVTAGTSRGIYIEGGTNSTDYSAVFARANGVILLKVQGDGNVGINQPNPIEAIDVVGNGKFSGTATAATPTLSTHLTTKAYVDGLAGSSVLLSGTYTPTLTAGTNTNVSVGANLAHYTRIGNEVSVKGSTTIGITNASTSSDFQISLPIASNMTGNTDAVGLGTASNFSDSVNNIIIYANSATDRALVAFKSGTSTSSTTVYYSFTYTVK